MQRLIWLCLVTAGAVACGQEYEPEGAKPGPVGIPAPKTNGPEEIGQPPQWSSCWSGYTGIYSNLTVDHPDVTPRASTPEPSTDPAELDWWDRSVYEKHDGSLDFGENWWPVDEGLEDDPSWFAVVWHAWIRVDNATDLSFVLGAADDAWVQLDEQVVVSVPGIHDLERETYSVPVAPGQMPITVRYAHRGSDVAGFSFRLLANDDIALCAPWYGE